MDEKKDLECVLSNLEVSPRQNILRKLEAMAKYPEGKKFWLFEDGALKIAVQLYEPELLLGFKEYESLLNEYFINSWPENLYAKLTLNHNTADMLRLAKLAKPELMEKAQEIYLSVIKEFLKSSANSAIVESTIDFVAERILTQSINK